MFLGGRAQVRLERFDVFLERAYGLEREPLAMPRLVPRSDLDHLFPRELRPARYVPRPPIDPRPVQPLIGADALDSDESRLGAGRHIAPGGPDAFVRRDRVDDDGKAEAKLLFGNGAELLVARPSRIPLPVDPAAPERSLKDVLGKQRPADPTRGGLGDDRLPGTRDAAHHDERRHAVGGIEEAA